MHSFTHQTSAKISSLGRPALGAHRNLIELVLSLGLPTLIGRAAGCYKVDSYVTS